MTAVLLGTGYWLFFAAVEGDLEAWDTSLYFYGLPLLLLLSCLLGWWFPRSAAQAGALVGLSHFMTPYLIQVANHGFGSHFWPIMYGYFALLTLATSGAAMVGRKMSRRLG